ncbi:MAG: hypothetical protein CSA31_02420 [Desulfobulbus propionicus]|nr:MAG: hypothetical protein CSB34_00175 [Desulfobulbus propionicus]PIE60366.1 MAG: hypothetical protein CSA31_02420 [Desulfobulbus propionicus]
MVTSAFPAGITPTPPHSLFSKKNDKKLYNPLGARTILIKNAKKEEQEGLSSYPFTRSKQF